MKKDRLDYLVNVLMERDKEAGVILKSARVRQIMKEIRMEMNPNKLYKFNSWGVCELSNLADEFELEERKRYENRVMEGLKSGLLTT